MGSKPWADQPFSLIPVPAPTEGISKETLKVATEMVLAHNLILRVLNSLYLQCTTPTLPEDINDLLIYAQSWHDGIHHHHLCEETVFFPTIEAYTGEVGIMEKNVSQHEAFHPGLEEFRKYVFETKVEDYDGKKLRSIMDGFGPILTTHLKEEIDTLLSLEKFGGQKLAKSWAELEVKIQEKVENKYRSIPMGLGGIDRTFEGGKYKYWPPIPWFLPYLAKWIFYKKHKGSWRFSPCDLFGNPRVLPFAETESNVVSAED